MSEAREFLDSVRSCLLARGPDLHAKGLSIHSSICAVVADAIREALATQPEPGAVPELPAHMVGPDHRGDYWMTMPDGTRHLIRSVPGYDGYAARMAEAWSAIAARERARRAGS